MYICKYISFLNTQKSKVYYKYVFNKIFLIALKRKNKQRLIMQIIGIQDFFKGYISIRVLILRLSNLISYYLILLSGKIETVIVYTRKMVKHFLEDITDNNLII